MPFAHVTLPTRSVEETATFFERTLLYRRRPVPSNSPVEVVWLELGPGHDMHVFFVAGFQVSPFEGEFGRHVAVWYSKAQLAGLKRRLANEGAELMEPVRATAVERFFFREPINGYVFEVIGSDP